MTTRVLIADDQEMVRTGFRMIVDSQPDMEVVGEARDGAEAVALARRLRPEVCLFDIRMPRMDGLEATRLLVSPDVAEPLRVVIVTTFDMDEYVYGALRGGAVGFLLKDSGPALLVEAVRAAANGEALVSPRSPSGCWSTWPPRPPRPRRRAARSPDASWTWCGSSRAGAPTTRSCGELFVSLSTVKTHLSSIQRRLDARNRVEIAAWAWESGLMR